MFFFCFFYLSRYVEENVTRGSKRRQEEGNVGEHECFFLCVFFNLKMRRAKGINAEENVTREREQRQEKGHIKQKKINAEKNVTRGREQRQEEGNVGEHECFFVVCFFTSRCVEQRKLTPRKT